ncbi:MAG TPA: HNH endonuclease [Candidatus Paceibacterota bacterium]|nr:HNH endonuclease [Candidatus Paceibacterota bacterium]
MSMPKKPRSACVLCGTETARAGYTYCSNKCQAQLQHESYIKKWKEGKITGLKVTGIVSRPVKRYLREKFGDKCCMCGWSEVNPVTGLVPLVADHIDGNWQNNTEENLRLVCPNCDALSPTYANLNKGNGRKGRAISKRAIAARLLI